MRTLVWRYGFRAHEDDLAGESGIPKSRRDGITGGTAACDQGSWLRFSISRRRRNDHAR
jgi:hypothetical protein